MKKDGRWVYPSNMNLWTRTFYVCKSCDARVGCYPNSDKPLGSLADKATRTARMLAHQALDPLWRDTPPFFTSRSAAYSWLRRTTGVAHIGESTIEQCETVVQAVKDLRAAGPLPPEERRRAARKRLDAMIAERKKR